MGCATTTPQEIGEMEQKQILVENASLKQRLSELQQEMDKMKHENSKLNETLEQQDTKNVSPQIYKLQQEIVSVKSATKDVNILKLQISTLKKDNKRKDTEIKQQEAVTLTQLSDINAIKTEVDRLKQEFKELEYKDDNISKYLCEQKNTFPFSIKLTEGPLFSVKPWLKSWKIPIGTVITIEETNGNLIRLSSPYNGWFTSSSNAARDILLPKNISGLSKWEHFKASILLNFLQLNDTKLAITLLQESEWNVRDAIDKYYITKYKIDIEYIEIWQWKQDDNNWKRYNKKQMELIDELKIDGIFEFSKGKHKYQFHKIGVDFGEQINIKSNKKREVRKIKVKKNKSNDIECTEIWEWQTDDKKSWIQYEKQHMEYIKQLKIGGDYTFSVGKKKYKFYKLSDDSGEQINVSTNYKRITRKRQINIKKIDGIRYPEFWLDSGCYYHDFDKNKLYYMHSDEISIEEDYATPKLIDVPIESKTWKHVLNEYYKHTAKDTVIAIKMESVQNKYLWDKYQMAKKSLKKRIGDKRINEKWLWYGTNPEMTKMVISQGFRKEYHPPDCPYGEGIYLSVDASQWTNTSLMYCKVLCGEYKQGSKDIKLTNWPLKNNGSGQLIDSLVNDIKYPTMFIIHDDCRVYPMYVVHTASNKYNQY
eukprot:77428_1